MQRQDPSSPRNLSLRKQGAGTQGLNRHCPHPSHCNPRNCRPRCRGGRPGGHSEGPSTRSHPELGRENPQRQWYCTPRCGRVGRCQARNPPFSPRPYRPRTAVEPIDAGWSSPVARQAHNLKVVGSNPTPATTVKPLISRTDQGLLLFAIVSPCHCCGSDVEARGGRLRDRISSNMRLYAAAVHQQRNADMPDDAVARRPRTQAMSSAYHQ